MSKMSTCPKCGQIYEVVSSIGMCNECLKKCNPKDFPVIEKWHNPALIAKQKEKPDGTA